MHRPPSISVGNGRMETGADRRPPDAAANHICRPVRHPNSPAPRTTRGSKELTCRESGHREGLVRCRGQTRRPHNPGGCGVQQRQANSGIHDVSRTRDARVHSSRCRSARQLDHHPVRLAAGVRAPQPGRLAGRDLTRARPWRHCDHDDIAVESARRTPSGGRVAQTVAWVSLRVLAGEALRPMAWRVNASGPSG